MAEAGGQGVAAYAHPDFSRSVNSISTREGRLCPPYYSLPLQIFRPTAIPEGLIVNTYYKVSTHSTTLHGFIDLR